MSANIKRGESVIQVGGREIRIRLTLDTLVRIEAATGSSMFKFLRQLQSPEDLPVTLLLKVIDLAVKAGPDAGSPPQPDEWIAGGLPAILAAASQVAMCAMGNSLPVDAPAPT